MLDRRAYPEAVKRLAGVTLDDLPKRFATVLGRLKGEADELTSLLAAVLALDEQIQGLRLDFGAVKGKVRRAGNGRLSIEMAGGGVVEKEIARLPAKVVATLYRKSEEGSNSKFHYVLIIQKLNKINNIIHNIAIIIEIAKQPKRQRPSR